MKLDLYGCTYIEELNHIRRLWNKRCFPRGWDSLDELKRKKEKVNSRNFENYFQFHYLANQNKSVFIKTYEVDKFDPNEPIKLDEKEYKILHHSYDVENNKQIVVIDKELKRESISEKEKDSYYKEFLREKEYDLLRINEHIKEKEEELNNKNSEKKGFWSQLFS